MVITRLTDMSRRGALLVVAAAGLAVGPVADAASAAGSVPASARGSFSRAIQKSPATDEYALAGTWTLVLTAKTGQFTSSDPNVLPSPPLPVRSAGKGKLSFRDPNGTGACRPAGTYRFRRTEDALRLSVVKDDCDGRRLLIKGTWRAA